MKKNIYIIASNQYFLISVLECWYSDDNMFAFYTVPDVVQRMSETGSFCFGKCSPFLGIPGNLLFM